MKKSFILIAFSLLLFSCKKDKLEDGKEIFIGKWVWYETSHNYGYCDGDSFFEILTPVIENANYSMIFSNKGLVRFYENDQELRKDRVVLGNFGSFCATGFESYESFDIYLNNEQKDPTSRLYGCVNADTIVLIRGFPYENFEEGCESYTSYFVKQ
ncbi:MAG: hypothetical protein GQ574_26455 [Crocinitomix sp.]|nr:hypothetical protein [Crocinitomix sp.]